MRIALFSPLPPARSGIADYTAALLDPLRRLAEVQTFDGEQRGFDSSQYDALVYQLGNNEYHAAAYEAALRHPGIVVLHEANLHHLIAEMTIKRGDWDAYLREVEYNGGPAALAHGQRVRALEVGPDYEGLPMLRRVLEKSTGVIVHSRAVRDQVRAAGYQGPVGVIPHGAWVADGDRNGYRFRLGLDETTPLVGIFGFLKPYKRIAESLRAFRRLVRVEPRAKMILVGEPHPDFPVASLIQSLELTPLVRVLGFVPVEDLTGYMAACDVVLNLRYPTVGESSGTLLRALGLGRAVVVSDVGSFREYPDDVCLKAPVDGREEDLLYEYLNLLLSRPDVARRLGRRAREWVESECAWETVAERYLEFLHRPVSTPDPPPQAVHPAPLEPAAPVEEAAPPIIAPESITTWTEPGSGDRAYVETHLTRLTRTLQITPPGTAEDRILEMGAYLQITPSLRSRLGYGYVRGCYYGPLGKVDHKQVVSAEGEIFECDVDLFDAEKDRFPYDDHFYSTVLCCELIEHLPSDPMHMMSEINRILKPGGHLVLTTPNIGSLRAISAILQGYHPGFFPAYIRPSETDEETEARHNREYTPKEIHRLLTGSGFEVTLLETGEFRDEPRPELGWVAHMLERYQLPTELRGDGIFIVGRKTGRVRDRYPGWLYD
ncbi:MAG: glycosyltransferase [Bryobacteraceae bacterium]|nr:glycosyltransferase [Bryobacteraceae bacterium]